MNIKENWNHLSDKVKDLILYADNDHCLKNDSKQCIKDKMSKKFYSKEYKRDEAKNAWGYHVDRASSQYHKEKGDQNIPWHKAWPKADRKAAAAHYENEHYEELKPYKITKEEENYENLLESVLDKKPLNIGNIFDTIMREKVTAIVLEKKEVIRKVLFKEDTDAFTKVKDLEDDDEDGLENDKKKKNAFHASIHSNDTTGE